MYDWMPRFETKIRLMVMSIIYGILFLASLTVIVIFSKKSIEDQSSAFKEGIIGFFIGLVSGLAVC